jgi:MerR family transcriptional regulator, thiopeptide resistance regulator
LQQALSLRALGFSLEQVRECLDRSDYSPLEVTCLHTERLREQIELKRKLCERLDAIASHLRAAGEVSAEDFLQPIEEMTMIESYYTPEQMEYLKKRGELLGDERIQQVQKEWPELISQVRATQQKGLPPTDPEVQELARRWLGLINEFTGGDQGIFQSLSKLWKEQGDNLIAKHGTEYDWRDLSDYIARAKDALASE